MMQFQKDVQRCSSTSFSCKQLKPPANTRSSSKHVPIIQNPFASRAILAIQPWNDLSQFLCPHGDRICSQRIHDTWIMYHNVSYIYIYIFYIYIYINIYIYIMHICGNIGAAWCNRRKQSTSSFERVPVGPLRVGAVRTADSSHGASVAIAGGSKMVEAALIPSAKRT